MVQRGQLDNYEPELLQLEKIRQDNKFDFLDMARKPQSSASSAKPSAEQKWEKAWSKKKRQPRALKKANAMRAIKE